MNRIFTIAVTALTLSTSLWAHDIVLVPNATGATVRYGHAGDWQPIEERRLVDFQTYRDEAAAVDTLALLKPQGLNLVLRAVRPAGQAQLLAARYDNGLWARMPVAGSDKPKARNTSRVMLPDATLVTANLKFAKALVATAGDKGLYKRQLGHLLELVPQSNPALLASGDALDVLVLFQGQPLAGAGIEVGNLVDKLPEDAIKRYVTDAQGIARVTLRERGVNMLGVDVERANDGSLGAAATKLGADKLVMVATYTFVR